MANMVFNLPTIMEQAAKGNLTLTDMGTITDCFNYDKGASTQDAMTASTTQTLAGGTLINAAISRITVANANDAITLNFNAIAGRKFTIINDSGNIVTLFPKLGDKLCDAAISAGVTIADNTISTYMCPLRGLWFGGATTFEA